MYILCVGVVSKPPAVFWNVAKINERVLVWNLEGYLRKFPVLFEQVETLEKELGRRDNLTDESSQNEEVKN